MSVHSLATSELGYFGKYPGYADFIQRRLPVPVMSRMRQWVEDYMDAGAEQFEQSWPDIYRQSPVWRFVLHDLRLNDDSPVMWLGAMMPSVDRRGRYFPLFCAASTAVRPPVSLLRCAAATLDALEARMLNCLGESTIDPRDIGAYLQAPLPAISDPAQTPIGKDAEDDEGADPLGDDALMLASVERLLANTQCSYGVWQARHVAGGRAPCEACAGFPRPADFAALQAETIAADEAAHPSSAAERLS